MFSYSIAYARIQCGNLKQKKADFGVEVSIRKLQNSGIVK